MGKNASNDVFPKLMPFLDKYAYPQEVTGSQPSEALENVFVPREGKTN